MDGLLELLATRREEVARCFERELRARPREGERSALLGTLPRMLDGLQAALEAGRRGQAPAVAASSAGAPALPRGGPRPSPGFSMGQLVHEHGVLRDCLLNLLEERGGCLLLGELRTLHRFVDQALETALAERERQDAVARDAAAPVRLGEDIVGAVVVSTDLTQHQLREEELRRTAEFRERFLGIVSHDLRNPLNAISLSASVLLREEELPARARKMAGRISQSAERMGRMISDLLDFTRGRLGGGIPLMRRPGDLRLICRPVLEELGLGGPGSPLRLSTEGDLQGEWDADRLAQLVGNLVKNALDYSPPGSPVTVALSDEGPWIRLEVHNHGEPIPADVLPQLFEPFRRGMRQHEEEAQHSGLGLGLFIAQQLTLAHGGTLEALSTREEGTTFRVRLPRAAPAG